MAAWMGSLLGTVGYAIVKSLLKWMVSVKHALVARLKTRDELIERRIKASETPGDLDDAPLNAAWAYMGFATMHEAKTKLAAVFEILGRPECRDNPQIYLTSEDIRATVKEAIRILDEQAA